VHGIGPLLYLSEPLLKMSELNTIYLELLDNVDW